MRNRPRGKLELMWMGKDQALIPTSGNTYDYEWVDRNDPRACQTHYLIHEGHVGDPNDGGIHDNLLVTGESGDVLEALTREPALAERFVGRVKCIYIDPPFNTEKTFSHYEDNLEHSVWLTMMRDRLVLLKKLLAEDGSIWVHLDDSENHRMRVLLDEVFGASNFVADVAWQKSDTLRNDSRGFSADFDYILVYAKSSAWVPRKLERPESLNAIYRSPDGDPRDWFNGGPTAPGARTHQGMVYGIQNPVTGVIHYPLRHRCWALGQTDVLRMVSEYADYELQVLDDAQQRAVVCGVTEDEVRADVPALVLTDPIAARATGLARWQAGRWPQFYFTGVDATGGPGKKTYVPSEGVPPRTWWPNSEVGSNRTAKAEAKSVVPDAPPFATPKPEALLERVLQLATDPGDIVLDCFAGSGTTAAVAHKMGRRWVTCELLPETVSNYIRPRLDKVVAGKDAGGVTSKVSYEAVAPLPGKTTIDAARTFNTVLGRVLKSLGAGDESSDAADTEPDDQESLPELDGAVLAQVKAAAKILKAATRVKKSTTLQWAGGGGFDVARLSPEWVAVETNTVSGTPDAYLRSEATGEVLARSVAAHLGFHYLPNNPRFAGRKGRQWLAVVEGMFTPALLEEFARDIPHGHALTVCCFGAGEGLDRDLRRAAKGSRLLVMPEDLFMLNTWEA